VSNRPLPRREQSRRKDYDLLVVSNRHTVTAAGWFHEQDNTKWVKRDGQSYPLCREVGLNPYRRVGDHDFTKANDYWARTATYWRSLRHVWEELAPREGSAKFALKANGSRLEEVIEDFAEQAEDGSTVAEEQIRAALKPFVVKVSNP
jgi:TfoX/Sxy family transcriptional regulator of competence genes